MFHMKRIKITLSSNHCRAFKDLAVKVFAGFGERQFSPLPSHPTRTPIINELVVHFASWISICELNRRHSEFYRFLLALSADMPQGRMLDGFRFFLPMRPSSYDGTAGSDVTKSSFWVCQILPPLWSHLQLLHQSVKL